jgi:integrase
MFMKTNYCETVNSVRSVAIKYLNHHDFSRDYARSLIRVAESFDAYCRIPPAEDSSLFSGWLKSLPLSNTTKTNYRRMMVTLIKWGNLHHLCDYDTDLLPRVKQKKLPTIAWTEKEVLKLYKSVTRCNKRFQTGCPERLYWQTFILVGYETGIRLGDLLTLTHDRVRGNRLYITHSKTGVASAKCITKYATRCVNKMICLSTDDTVLGWALSRKYVTIKFASLVRNAGLSGTIKYLRRSGATHCEKHQPGSASRFLGHISGQALARRNYIDWTQLSESIPRPPALMTTGYEQPVVP